jgi:hypothetical protein
MVPGLTHHARARMQQRGIPESALDALLDFGRAAHDHRGAEIVFFDKRARRRVERVLGNLESRRLERFFGTYAVLGVEGEIRTVGHRIRRVRHA